MKKVILLAFLLAGLNGYAQDFKINSDVTYAGGIISKAPNNIKLENLHLNRINDSTWALTLQFFTEDSLGHQLIPNDDLIGTRARGTVKEFMLTSKQANFPADSLMQLFLKPYLATIYPGRVSKGTAVFNKK